MPNQDHSGARCLSEAQDLHPPMGWVWIVVYMYASAIGTCALGQGLNPWQPKVFVFNVIHSAFTASTWHV